MPTLLETFASYLPALIVPRRAADPSARGAPAQQTLPAALLFADISGFTSLTEQLAQRGPAGVEELTRMLNVSFGQILDLIESHGGDVIKFAGDALLAIWPADGGIEPLATPGELSDGYGFTQANPLRAATLRAAQCALAIHSRMANFYRLIDSARLALRIGVAAGDVSIMQIGGVYGRWELLAAGEPLHQVAAAEQRAAPQEVVLAPAAWRLVSGYCAGTPLATDLEPEGEDWRPEIVGRPASCDLQSSFVRLSAIHSPIAPRAAVRPPLTPDMDATLRSFIPGAVLSRLIAGETTWLAELRRVTVLFVNLPDLSVDSGASQAALEQAQRVMRLLQTVLYRYEGSVNKISLDDKGVTLVAALGLPPLAHQDDATRGTLAALAAREALRDLGLRCAIGVASGRAFCGEIGSSHRREYTMIGDVVNLAARLMQAAASDERRATSDEPQIAGDDRPSSSVPSLRSGQALRPSSSNVLCDEVTFQLARSRVVFDQLPPISVKGKAEPIPVYRPAGEAAPNPRFELHNSGAAGELVGREAEQATLIGHLQTLLRGDHGGVVMIEGEAGMGKSTLIERLRQIAADLQVTILLGAGDATEQAAPYYAWRGIFGQLLDLPAIPTAEAGMQRLLSLLDDAADLAPLLNAVLPLDLPESGATAQLAGERRADATRDLLLRLLQRAAERGPTLLILEDAHWFDSASWALALAASQRVRPLLLVMSMRPVGDGGARDTAPPEYRRLRATAKARLRLDALAPDEAIALVCRRLGVTALPDSVAELIREKAQGHPFFSEELAYALRDAGLLRISDGSCTLEPAADLQALSFPETVQGAIISRIDRLTPTQQLTLKVASVIGRVFPVRTLRAVYPMATDKARLASDLAALARLDITPLEAPEPDPAYIFKHAITQDVVYNLMLFAQRRQLHRAVAEWYEHTYDSSEFRGPTFELKVPATRNSELETQNSALAPFYPLLAYHWRKAGVSDKAIGYLEAAGRSALEISAAREARGSFEQALELLAGASAENQPQLRLRQATLARLLAEACHQLGDLAAARAALEQSLELARAEDDRDRMSDALSMLGRIATETGAYTAARSSLQASLALARELGPGRIAGVLSNLGNVAMREGSYEESERHYQQSLALFTAAGDQPGVAQVLNGMGNGAIDRRMYDIARYCYEESLAIRRALGDRWGVAACLSNLGWVAHLQHAYAKARDRYEESLAISRAIGDRRGATIVLNNLGFTAYELGDDGAAARYFDEALRAATEIGVVPLALEVLVGIARLRARAGQPEQAAELLGLALAHPASNSDVSIQVELSLGDLAAVLPPARLDAARRRGAALQLEAVVSSIVGQS